MPVAFTVPTGMLPFANWHKAMASIARISDLLGGRRVLGRALRAPIDLVPLLREGLPYEALVALTGNLEISVDVAATALQLARRTLARRKEQNRLDLQESERVVRLAQAAARAAAVLGGLDKARLWLLAENRALAGVAPMSLLDTDVGMRAVEDVLLRIEHGVYS